jgi:hypothetical protein
VRDALGARSAAALAGEMKEDMVGSYNPFHLLYADGRETFLTVLGEEEVRTRALRPGVHVVCNGSDAPSGACKADRIRERVLALDPGAPFETVVRGLEDILGDDGDPSDPLGSTCVHTPAYGTCSSAIVAVGGPHRAYWHAEGPPCRTPYRDFSHLLDAIQ